MLSSSDSIRLLLFLVLSFLLFQSSSASSENSTFATPPSSSNATTIYDLLPRYGLPPGLLPDIVKSFSVSNDGAFAVDLYGECYVDFEYLVYYAPRVSGVLKYGGLDDLKGIQVRRFLIWFDVDAIKVDLPPTDFIYFQVGWITRKLRVEQFETVHSCRRNKGLLRRLAEAIDWLLLKF